MKTGQPHQPAARGIWADLVNAAGTLRKAVGQTNDSLTLDVTIDAVQKLLAIRQQMNLAVLGLETDRFEGEMRASVHRLQDLVQYGQTEVSVQGVANLALVQGFEVRGIASQYYAGDNLVGWRMRFVRP